MTLLLFFIFVNIALLIPAFSFLSLTNMKNNQLILPISYALNISLYALMSTAYYVIRVPSIFIQILFWIYIIIGLTLFVIKKFYIDIYKYKYVMLCLLLMTGISLAFISLSNTSSVKFIPDPEFLSNRNYDTFNVKVLNVSQTGANDNYIPYRQAQFFVNRSDPAKDSFIEEWGVHFFQRTPLMGAVSGTMFIALNEKLPIDYLWSNSSSDPHKTYEQFQILSHILNSLIIVPAFFVIIKFFDRKTAKLTLLFVVTSQFFIYNSVFSWPKTFVGFFILLSILLLLEKKTKYTILAGASAGLAYLAHDLAVLYIGAILIMLLTNKRFRDILLFGLSWLIISLPWVIISSIIYKKPSSFVLYPLSVDGIPQPALRNEIISKFRDTSVWRLVQIRLESLYYLLSPYQLIYSEGGQDAGRRAWALGLFSIPGALGLGTVIPTFVGIIKNIKKLDVFIIIFIPVILSVLVIGWPRGLGAFHFAQVSIVLLLAFASSWLIQRKSYLVVLLVMILNYIQLIFFTIYSYGDSYKNWFNAQDLFTLLFINLIYIITIFLALNIVKPSIIKTSSRKNHKLKKISKH